MGTYDSIVDDIIGKKKKNAGVIESLQTGTLPDGATDYSSVVNEILGRTGDASGPSGPSLPNIIGPKRETGAIDARNNQPIMEDNPDYLNSDQEHAGFSTEMKASLVDDPGTKIQIYAKSRGLPVDQYAMDDEGRIIYDPVGDGKQYYYESGMGLYGGHVKGLANMATRLPGDAATAVTAGSSAFGLPGPLLAPVVAAGAEGLRKTAANAFLDEPQSTAGNALSMLGEGAMALAFESVPIAGGKFINKVKRAKGGRVADAFNTEISRADKGAARQALETGRGMNVELPLPSVLDDASKFNKMASRPGSAGDVKRIRTLNRQQTEKAADEFVSSISKTTDALESGKLVQKAADTFVEKELRHRADTADALYKDAFAIADANNLELGVDNILEFIEKELEFAEGAVKNVLTKFRKRFKPPKVDDMEAGSGLLDEFGRPIGSKAADVSPTKSLQQLHGIRVAMSAEKNKFKKGPIRHYYKEVLDRMDKLMDAAVPEYGLARDTYSSDSGFIDKLFGKTLIGKLRKLEDDQLVTATRRLFNSVESSPATVVQLKEQIRSVSPAAWDAVVASKIADSISRARSAITKTGSDNFSGTFFKELVNDLPVLSAAMDSTGRKNLAALMEVMRRSGLLFQSESKAAAGVVAGKELSASGKNVALNVGEQVLNPYNVPRIGSTISKRLNNALMSVNDQEIAKALMNPNTADAMLKISQYSKDQLQMANSVVTFLESSGKRYWVGSEAETEELPGAAVGLMKMGVKNLTNKGKWEEVPEHWENRDHPDFVGSIFSDPEREIASAEITAFHGSPYRFAKFKPVSKSIGSGEGHAAFGHGLYLSESKEVANTYARSYSQMDLSAIKGSNWDKVLSAKTNNGAVKNSRISLRYRLNDIINDSANIKDINTALSKRLSESEKNLANSKKILADLKKTGKSSLDKSYHESLIKVHTNGVAANTDEIKILRGFIDDINKGNIKLDKANVDGPTLYRTKIHEGKDPSEYNYLSWYDELKPKQLGKLRDKLEEVGIRPNIGYRVTGVRGKNIREWAGTQSDYVRGIVLHDANKRYFTTKDELIGWLENTAKRGMELVNNKNVNVSFGKKQVKELQSLVADLKKGLASTSNIPQGQELYKGLVKELGSKEAASEFLRANGIDGIKYPVDTIRNPYNKTKPGLPQNYVVFDSKNVTIKARKPKGNDEWERIGIVKPGTVTGPGPGL